MRTLLSSIALSFALAFTGCGGGGGGNPPPPPPPPTPSTFTVSGTITGAVQGGVTVKLDTLSTVTAADGTFTFTNVANGSYVPSATLANFAFHTTSTPVVVNGANVTGVNFTAVRTFTVTANASEGSVFSPLYQTVEEGVSAVFAYGVYPGYSKPVVTGGDGTLTGSAPNYTYTTGPIHADTVVTGSVTKDPVDNRYSLNWMVFSENVVFDDEFTTKLITLRASASGTGFHLAMQYFATQFDKTNPLGFVTLPMIDTGVLDSKIPGSRFYEVTFKPAMVAQLQLYGNTASALPISVEARDNATGNVLFSVNPINTQMSLGVVSRSLAVGTTQIAPDVYAASNMVNVVMPDFTSASLATDAMKKVYMYYTDVCGAAAINMVGRTHAGNIPGGALIKNTVTGINVPLQDGSAAFGSNGVLSSVIYGMPSDIVNNVFLHEVGHSLGAFYLNNPSLNLANETRIHAAMIGTVGQMGGEKLLVELPSGDFVVTQPDLYSYTSRKFASLEQYITGFGPASAVQPMRFLVDPTVQYNTGDIVPRAKTMLVTIDDIVRVYGVRNPAFNGPKSIQMIFVCVSERPMTAAEVALMNRIAIYYGSNAIGGEVDTRGVFPVRSMPSFNAATNGNGNLVTTLPPRK